MRHPLQHRDAVRAQRQERVVVPIHPARVEVARRQKNLESDVLGSELLVVAQLLGVGGLEVRLGELEAPGERGGVAVRNFVQHAGGGAAAGGGGEAGGGGGALHRCRHLAVGSRPVEEAHLLQVVAAALLVGTGRVRASGWVLCWVRRSAGGGGGE